MDDLYIIDFSPESWKHLSRLKENEPSAFKKAEKLIKILEFNPWIASPGRPEVLKGKPNGCLSHRITQKHRLVYQIDDEKKHVIVLRAYGHYDDK